MTHPDHDITALVERSLLIPECDPTGMSDAIVDLTAALEAQQAALAAKDGEIDRLREALKPFVEGYSHTSVFLRSREKMHPAGQDLYRKDVNRACAALGGMKS